jgi:hypothetical protein
MLRPAPYLSEKLTRPIRTKDGGVLRQQWQRACELLVAEADIDAFSKQIELALF